jgi:ActR/RegA family two-component response regulator
VTRIDVTTGPLLVALRRVDHARWSRVVRAALASRGTVMGAAVALRIERRTLDRWLGAEPGLRAGIDLPGPVRSAKRR